MNVQHAAQGTTTLTRNVAGVTASIGKTEAAATDFLAVSKCLQDNSATIAQQIGTFFDEIRVATSSDLGARKSA